MVKRILSLMAARKKQSRLKQYRLTAIALSEALEEMDGLPEALCRFWRGLDLRDIQTIDPKYAMEVTLPLAHSNLPWLVAFLGEYNNCIAEERDVDTMMKNEFLDIKPMNLDLYLADDNQHSIDVKAVLMRLQGRLLQHCDLLGLQESQYYQRQAERVYRDLATLSYTILNVLEEQE